MHATAPLNGTSNGLSATTTTNGHHHHHDPASSAKSGGRHRLATRLIHEGSEASAETGAVIPGISLSTTYKQDAVGKHKGFEYTRSLNPNRLAFETLIASLELPETVIQPQLHSTEERTRLENLPSALAFSSGSAVTQAIVSSLVQTGGHIISVNDVYGGTYRYLTKVASNSGITTTFLELTASEDVDDLEGYRDTIIKRLEDAFRPETQLVWLETPTNPTLRLVDIALVSEVAHRHNAVVVVDNTFLSPYYQRPLELGADIVTHSVTKYLNGHSDVIMGVLVTPRQDLLSKLRFYQNAGGAVPSSFDCWLAQRGCKTLHLRLHQHGLNALAIARWLKQQDWVKEVMYPGLEGGDGGNSRKAIRRLAWKQLSHDAREKIEAAGMTEETGFICGGMVSFRLDTSLAASSAPAAQISSDFLSSMKIFTLAESLGGIESLAELPSLMTHASVSDEDRAKLGIDDELIRLSVGVEDVRDLEHDLHQAALVALGKQQEKDRQMERRHLPQHKRAK